MRYVRFYERCSGIISRAYPGDVTRGSPATRLARVLRARNGAFAKTLDYDICFGGLHSVGRKACVWPRETVHCAAPRWEAEGSKKSKRPPHSQL
jgi:hypothetical protein